MFTTRAFATGIPTVLAGTPVVSAYENDSVTQITAGITLGVSHDSVVGMNLLTIVATGANGYEAGKDYNMVITTGTVDSVSVVGEVVGVFSLSRSAAAVDLANGTDGLGAIKTDTAATLVDTAVIGAAGAGLTDLGGMSTGMKAEVNTEADTALTDIGLDHLVSAAVIGTDVTDNSIIAQLVDTAATADWDNYDNNANSLTGIGVVAGSVLADTGTTIPGTITTLQADTDDLQVQIGTAGAGLTDLGGMSTAMKAEVNVEAKDVLFTDTDAEPAQGAPGATVSLSDKIGFLYKAWRNRSNQNATTYNLYADDATTVDHKVTVSDDGTTAEKGEVVTGP